MSLQDADGESEGESHLNVMSLFWLSYAAGH